jgi:hypothetical protein
VGSSVRGKGWFRGGVTTILLGGAVAGGVLVASDGGSEELEFPNRRGSEELDHFPNRATTGVPDGWVPDETHATTYEITAEGAVVEDVLMTDGADVVVKAENVTIRNFKLEGGSIVNRYAGNCYAGLVVEDSTFEPEPGQPYGPGDATIASGGFTARRVELYKRGEGYRGSDCGPITVEDSFAYIIGGAYPDACEDWHSDGFQAFHARGATFENNTIIFGTHCGTSPWFAGYGGDDPEVPSPNTGSYNVDRMLVAGAGYVFRQHLPGSVTGLRIVNNSWVIGPYSNRCSVISPWEAKLVTLTHDYTDPDGEFVVSSEGDEIDCESETVS